MRRKVDFNEISDGKLYKRDDKIKLGCDGCGKNATCCKVTDDTITLEPYDIYCLQAGLNKNFSEMMGSVFNLKVEEGIIVPFLLKKGSEEGCVFLESNGRCSIHSFRPGFCRLFPLGRIYEEDTFSYFNQIHECECRDKKETTVKEWLMISDIEKYENFVVKWHSVTEKCKENVLKISSDKQKELNMTLLTMFYVQPYDVTDDFYPQFEKRVTVFLELYNRLLQ